MESAVIGIPSEFSDEDVKAYVVLKPGAVPRLLSCLRGARGISRD